jgi:sec-independent protein translocase protein TatC
MAPTVADHGPLPSLDPLAQAWLGLALVLAVSAGLVLLLYARRSYLAPTRVPVSVSQHLRELGARLTRIVLLFAYWTALFTTVRFEAFRWRGLTLATPVWDIFDNTSARIYAHLAEALLPEGVQIVVTRPTEAVMAQIQISLLLAFILALPALAFEAWAFFGPGLEPRERRLLGRALPFSALLFLAGVAFSYRFITPLLLKVLYAFAGPLGALPLMSAGALVGTFVTFALVFGLAFQLPLVMALLVRFRFTTPQAYIRRWRHATIVIFVVAALVTDPTLVSQLIISGLLLVLYWGGVALSYLARPASSATPQPRAARAL